MKEERYFTTDTTETEIFIKELQLYVNKLEKND